MFCSAPMWARVKNRKFKTKFLMRVYLDDSLPFQVTVWPAVLLCTWLGGCHLLVWGTALPASLCIVVWYTHLILTDRVTTFLTHLDLFLSFPKWLYVLRV